jgi:dockerin type I repeat protein
MTTYNQDNEPEDFQVSPKLIEDLNTLYTPAEKVPLQVDRNILDQARRHFTRRRNRIWLRVLRWSSVAAAAVIVFLFVLVDPLGDNSSSQSQNQPEVGPPLAKMDEQEKKEVATKTVDPQEPGNKESELTVAMNTDHDLPGKMNLDSVRPLSAPTRFSARDAYSAVEAKQDLQKKDLDHSGRVDILDAFLLARQIEKQLELQSQWDVTGDGAINQNDVDAIASAAVRVRKDVL